MNIISGKWKDFLVLPYLCFWNLISCAIPFTKKALTTKFLSPISFAVSPKIHFRNAADQLKLVLITNDLFAKQDFVFLKHLGAIT